MHLTYDVSGVDSTSWCHFPFTHRLLFRYEGSPSRMILTDNGVVDHASRHLQLVLHVPWPMDIVQRNKGIMDQPLLKLFTELIMNVCICQTTSATFLKKVIFIAHFVIFNSLRFWKLKVPPKRLNIFTKLHLPHARRQ